ncbi:calcium/sodium antiporter [Anaerocolumna sp. AGMB13025]|uniref:calcium/sodium antiporter n=1 Tax=Anaerocolumna sp. AGMB13025 TaxID=3039116 RepID=UPI00241E41D0|nr:calcium/sodium antiporter [Anaerocolumna sp. AGMB13025]WFR57214.1 calcium/sodium antiporter [Anaerocolumna sp. AGMB13025]
MQYFLLVLGLVLIIKCADILIDSSSKIAKRYGVSSFVIGITVVAFGTSAPELAVGVVSGISHTNQLTLGNIIGSSLANTAMIVGIAAIIMPLRVKDSVVRREIPMLIGIQILLAVMLFRNGVLSRLGGVILILGFAAFMLYIMKDSKGSMKIEIDAEGDIDTDADGNQLSKEIIEAGKNENIIKLWCFSIISLTGLFIGGKLTVDSSTSIAESLGLSETLIGLTVVAIATTMPELITSIIAALKKEPDIVLGNCIGSNIFNILLVLGLSSAISPIPVETSLWLDVAVMILLTVLVFIISWFRKSIKRRAGILLLLSYVLYLVYKVISVL